MDLVEVSWLNTEVTMPTPRNRNVEIYWSLPGTTSKRRYCKNQTGWNGDKITPYAYRGYTTYSYQTQKHPTTDNWQAIDGPNSNSNLDFLAADGLPGFALSAYNKAYRKFRDKALGEASQLGVFFAEWKQSLDLIGSAAIRLAALVEAARTFNVKKLRRAMRRASNAKKRTAKKFFKNAANKSADEWTAFWFGWSANTADIYNAAQVISGPLPWGDASGASFAHQKKQFIQNGTLRTTDMRVIHKLGAEVVLSNPNLFLAGRLGLANPALIGWELVKLSFLIDWVFDVSTFLGSFTDFIGVNVNRPYTIHLAKWHDTKENPGYLGVQACRGVSLIRRVGFPKPFLNTNVYGNLGTSVTRSASAVALLIQNLRKIL